MSVPAAQRENGRQHNHALADEEARVVRASTQSDWKIHKAWQSGFDGEPVPEILLNKLTALHHRCGINERSRMDRAISSAICPHILAV